MLSKIKGEHPGAILKSGSLHDCRNISRITGIPLKRLTDFADGVAILTQPECNKLDKAMNLGPSYMFQNQKTYVLDVMDMSIVRHNLMTQPDYTGYCGAEKCPATWPRTRFTGEQFRCVCGWVSRFPDDFMKQYKENWSIK